MRGFAQFTSIADLNVAAAAHTAAAPVGGSELDVTSALERATQLVVAHDLAGFFRRNLPGLALGRTIGTLVGLALRRRCFRPAFHAIIVVVED
jgi:hypothetical protein